MLGFVPAFLKAVPDSALPGAWQEMKTLQLNPNSALPPKIKELIGLAVAAQVPCKYCTYAHTEFAKLGGANKDEVDEAVMLAALARHWSTFLNGMQIDETKFRAELTALIERMKKSPPPSSEKPASVTDGKAALAQAQASLGMVPEFLKKFPEGAVAGAWTEWRDVELSPQTALPDKYKSLIGLAVSSQIPCKYCTLADTEFAKLSGASEAEIGEAVAMAALTRHWSTVLNGLQTDEQTFRRDVDHLVRNAKAMMKSAAQAQREQAHKQQQAGTETEAPMMQHAQTTPHAGHMAGEMPMATPRNERERKVSAAP